MWPAAHSADCRYGVRLTYGEVSRHHLISVIEPACGAAGSAALLGLVAYTVRWRGAHDGCELGARRDAQLREDPVQMVADGAARQV
jgi:hypothetical protein